MPQGLDIAKVFAGDFSSIDSIKSFFNWKGVKESVKKAEQNKDQNYLLEELITSERIESIYLKIPQWIEKITIFDNVRFVFLIDDLIYINMPSQKESEEPKQTTTKSK